MTTNKHFTEEEMTPNEPHQPPVFKLMEPETDESELDGDKFAPGKNAATMWMNKHKVPRVPVVALEPDMYKPVGQKYAVFSMIRPNDYGMLSHGDREYKGYLIKITGCFDTEQQAEACIEKVMSTNPHFDMIMTKCGEWSACDDDRVEDRSYADQMVKDILTGYFKSENTKVMSMGSRIQTSMDSEDRSEEVSQFYDDSQTKTNDKLLTSGEYGTLSELSKDLITSAQEQGTQKGTPMTLDEIAEEFNIKPSSTTVISKVISDEAKEVLVETVILEE